MDEDARALTDAFPLDPRKITATMRAQWDEHLLNTLRFSMDVVKQSKGSCQLLLLKSAMAADPNDRYSSARGVGDKKTFPKVNSVVGLTQVAATSITATSDENDLVAWVLSKIS